MSELRDTIQRLISESQPIAEHPTDAIMVVVEAALGEQRDAICDALEARAEAEPLHQVGWLRASNLVARWATPADEVHISVRPRRKL